jgi:hypothetical protein
MMGLTVAIVTITRPNTPVFQTPLPLLGETPAPLRDGEAELGRPHDMGRRFAKGLERYVRAHGHQKHRQSLPNQYIFPFRKNQLRPVDPA